MIEGGAVTVAMYCLIQFYIQLRKDLAPYSPFLKISAIKLVVFLSFWQSFMISILTSSTIDLVKPTAKMAYPDLKVGIPALLICIEMALFAVLHQWAFPWQPYAEGYQSSKYPASPIGPKQGGFLGLKALADAMNPWDLVKAFARGMKWLVWGVRHRESDPSYKSNFDINNPNNENDMALDGNTAYKGTEHLPIANEFRRSKFGMPSPRPGDEGAALIAHAQPNPLNAGGYTPARQRYDADGQDIHPGTEYIPGAVAAAMDPNAYHGHAIQDIYVQPSQADEYLERLRADRRRQTQESPSEEWAHASQPVRPGNDVQPEVHNALWGQKQF